MCDEKTNSAVTVKGTFLGQPIDLTITECGVPIQGEGEVSASATPDLPDGQVPPEAETPSADPAPESTPVSDEPKNPAGNAEQL